MQDSDTATDRSPHDDRARWAPRLRRCLAQLRAAQSDMEGLLPRQSGLVDAGDAPGLLELLGERQVVIERLQRAGDEFEPFRRRWNELMNALAPAERAALERDLTELTQSMERLAQRDAADRARLESLRQSIVDEMSGVARGRSAVAAYGVGGSTAPRFQDRAG